MPASLLSVLKGIGLDMGETIVLGILLKDGPLPARLIAKMAHMKRATTYDTLKALIQKGLVNEVRDAAVLHFQAVDPELLPNYLARKKADLEKKETELRRVLQALRDMKDAANRLPVIETFEGKVLVTQPGALKLSDVLPQSELKNSDISVQGHEVILSKENGEIAIVIHDASIAETIRTAISNIPNKGESI